MNKSVFNNLPYKLRRAANIRCQIGVEIHSDSAGHTAEQVRRGCRPNVAAARGFTLLEVIIVLALVLVISGLAFTTVLRPMAARRLQLAADQIRADWIMARNRAMSNGEIYCFQCELGANGYLVTVWTDTTLNLASPGGLMSPGALTSPGGVLPDVSSPLLDSTSSANVGDALMLPQSGTRKELPEKIAFADIQIDDPAQALGYTTDAISLTPDNSTILFYPDGTTTSALITLENEFGRRIDISLRGLTGAALVGEVYEGQTGGVTNSATTPAGGRL